MDFQQFLQEGVSKGIRPDFLTNLTRDARIETLEKLLIEKGLITKQELDIILGLELQKILNSLSGLKHSSPINQIQ